jgi:hypothetical protein
MSKFELHSYTKCENHKERILFIHGFIKSILLQAASETIFYTASAGL